MRETGSVVDQKSRGRPRTSNEDEERVRQAFLRSPRMSFRTAGRQLHLPHSIDHDAVHKRLRA
jgi:hypothetical protein